VQRIGGQIEEAVLLHTKVSARAARSRAQDLLVRVGIPAERRDKYPHQMSGGQRQRVLIALALACDPHLLIADEPTTALDVMVQAQVLALLEELQREKHLALLFITHDLSVLTHTCKRLAVMYAGRVVEEGPSESVFTDPQHPYSRALAAAFPTIGDQSSRMHPQGLAGDPPDPAALPTGCPFHLRCAVATEECTTLDVLLRDAGTDRRAACVHIGARHV
jgi:peptide/nickel transport system ATP-binding protein